MPLRRGLAALAALVAVAAEPCRPGEHDMLEAGRWVAADNASAARYPPCCGWDRAEFARAENALACGAHAALRHGCCIGRSVTGQIRLMRSCATCGAPPSDIAAKTCRGPAPKPGAGGAAAPAPCGVPVPVSYTHLTLPTILRV